MRKLMTLAFVGVLGLGLGACASSNANADAVPAPEATAEAAPAEGAAATEAPAEGTAEATEAPAEEGSQVQSENKAGPGVMLQRPFCFCANERWMRVTGYCHWPTRLDFASASSDKYCCLRSKSSLLNT